MNIVKMFAQQCIIEKYTSQCEGYNLLYSKPTEPVSPRGSGCALGLLSGIQ